MKSYRHINASHCKPSPLYIFTVTYPASKKMYWAHVHDVPRAAGTLLNQAPNYLISTLCGPNAALNCHI